MNRIGWQDEQAMSPAELAEMMDAESDKLDALLFTMTPREELSGIALAQRLVNQAFVFRARAVVAAYNRIAREQREFVADEVALACGFSPTGAVTVVQQALGLAALPGMLEGIEGGLLTPNHALCVLRELDRVELSDEQRAAIGCVVVQRSPGSTPGELIALTRRLILQVDLPTAMDREQVATGNRRVLFWGEGDGQAVTQLRGPAADQAAIRAVVGGGEEALPQARGDDRGAVGVPAGPDAADRADPARELERAGGRAVHHS